jgi:hypothetical protein
MGEGLGHRLGAVIAQARPWRVADGEGELRDMCRVIKPFGLGFWGAGVCVVVLAPPIRSDGRSRGGMVVAEGAVGVWAIMLMSWQAGTG